MPLLRREKSPTFYYDDVSMKEIKLICKKCTKPMKCNTYGSYCEDCWAMNKPVSPIRDSKALKKVISKFDHRINPLKESF
jgi:hypothetical protein